MVAASGLQCLFGIAGYLLLSQSGQWDLGSHGIWTTQLLVRLIAGALLIFAGFNDRRTLLFGATTILNATAFARIGSDYLIESFQLLPLRYFAALPLDALFPYYFWRFARVFPEAFLPRSLDRAIDWAERASLAAGLFLIASNLALIVYPQLTVLSAFNVSNPGSVFSPLLYSLAFPILLVLWLRMRSAREGERRRVQVFTVGLLVTIVPVLTFIVLMGISLEFRSFIAQEHIWILVLPLMQAFIIATPMITTYAVLVERILPVKILLRQTFRYSLGSGFVVLAIAMPVLLLLFYLYNSRSMSISALFDGYNGLFVALALALSLSMLAQRHRARLYLDELFFRAGYDANELLAELIQSVQKSQSLADVALATQLTLDRALHPQNSTLMFISNHEYLRDPRQELADMPLQSALAKQLFAAQDPLDAREIAAEPGGEAERWLSQANASFLIPIRAQAVAAGILVIGDKRSELPYTRQDFNFLNLVVNTVAAACIPLLDEWNVKEENKRAVECSGCGLVVPAPVICAACGGSDYTEALLPKVLHQQYEVKKVIGGGGMGVVYLAHDINLQRPVVLKSVASASAEELKFLREEARVMATLSHRHIAAIYRFESYQGMPILVCEYLENGTLADIIRDGYLASEEVVGIIEQVVQALAYLHEKGIVHGDVKPSNIGFDAEEAPKLLDFGLANSIAAPLSADGNFGSGGGTYAYMSPEKIQGHAFDQRVDLWALAVTMFEAMYGTNPFTGADLATVIHRVTHPEESILRAVESPSQFLQRALSSDITKRPQTTGQFAAMLREVG